MSRVLPISYTDDNIIEGLKNFDETAGTQLYNKHKDYCMRFMNNMHYDEETN